MGASLSSILKVQTKTKTIEYIKQRLTFLGNAQVPLAPSSLCMPVNIQYK